MNDKLQMMKGEWQMMNDEWQVMNNEYKVYCMITMITIQYCERLVNARIYPRISFLNAQKCRFKKSKFSNFKPTIFWLNQLVCGWLKKKIWSADLQALIINWLIAGWMLIKSGWLELTTKLFPKEWLKFLTLDIPVFIFIS